MYLDKTRWYCIKKSSKSHMLVREKPAVIGLQIIRTLRNLCQCKDIICTSKQHINFFIIIIKKIMCGQVNIVPGLVNAHSNMENLQGILPKTFIVACFTAFLWDLCPVWLHFPWDSKTWNNMTIYTYDLDTLNELTGFKVFLVLLFKHACNSYFWDQYNCLCEEAHWKCPFLKLYR